MGMAFLLHPHGALRPSEAGGEHLDPRVWSEEFVEGGVEADDFAEDGEVRRVLGDGGGGGGREDRQGGAEGR